MHPILFHFGPLTIYSYGAAIATAFLSGIFLASWAAKKEGIDPQKIMDLAFYILVAAIVGSRLLFVLINIRDYAENPLGVFKIWQGGLVFYGGLLGAIPVSIYYLRKNHLPVWPVADIVAPALALGEIFGRWGCFFAGCCYGKPSGVPWSVAFTDPDSLAPLHVHLHPTQLYSSVAALIIFLLLLYVRKIKRFHGQVFWSYLLLYSLARFVIEFFRGDERGFVWEGTLSTSQFIGIFIFAASIAMLYIKRKANIKNG